MLAKGIIIRTRNTYLGRSHFRKRYVGGGGGDGSSPPFKLNLLLHLYIYIYISFIGCNFLTKKQDICKYYETNEHQTKGYIQIDQCVSNQSWIRIMCLSGLAVCFGR